MATVRDQPHSTATANRLPRRRRWWWWALLVIVLVALVPAAYLAWTYHGPQAPVEVYHGVVYSCEELPQSSESGGLVHLVRADLTAPGVELYVTPMDADAVAHGWQHRLTYVSTAVRQHGLAAGVNGTLFDSDSGLVPLPGDRAKSNETTVADHVVSHVHRDTYLLWWDDARVAHLETEKPPSPAALAGARWAIGGQQPLLVDGRVSAWAGTSPDARTLIAANPEKRLVWLAVFDKASYRFAAQWIAIRGATLAVMVDGGTSAAMALGSGAKGVRGGRVSGNWRPVATVFGFRAATMDGPTNGK